MDSEDKRKSHPGSRTGKCSSRRGFKRQKRADFFNGFPILPGSCFSYVCVNFFVQDHHSGHVCHKCGWTFPNPHPSAKHRRHHKKVCGKIDGFKLASVDDKHQSDSDPSDDDHKPAPLPPPQPPSESTERGSDGKKGSDSVGVESERLAGGSEEEMFSDDVAEIEDSNLSRTAHKAVVLDTPGVDMNAEGIRDLTQAAAEFTGLYAHGDMNLGETKHTSQTAQKDMSLDSHGTEMKVEEIDSSETASKVVGGRNMKEMDSSHSLDAGADMNVEENKQSCWAEVVGLDARSADVDKGDKGNDGINHVLVNLPIVDADNGAYNKNMSHCDQFEDLDALQAKPVDAPQTSTSASILDTRTHFSLEQTQDASLSFLSSARESLIGYAADDSMESMDNRAVEKMEDLVPSVGLSMEAKHCEKCIIFDKEAKEKEEIDEVDKVPVMKLLFKDVAAESSEVGVQPDLCDAVTVETLDIFSKYVIADSTEADQKVCLVHDEQTGGPRGLKPFEESPHSIQSGPMKSNADFGVSVGASKANEASLPTECSANVVPTNIQVQEDILLMDGSRSEIVHEVLTLNQSSVREEYGVEKHQDIEHASTDCAAKDIGTQLSTVHEDSLHAEPSVVNTISCNNLFGGSNETEVSLETSTVPMTGDNVSDSLDRAQVQQEKKMHHDEFSEAKDSGCDLPSEGIPETPKSQVADSSEDPLVHLARRPSSETDFILDPSHGVVQENSTIPVAGGNINDPVGGIKVEEKATVSGGFDFDKDFGHDSLHEFIPETSMQPIDGSNNAYLVGKAEVHETIAIGADGPVMASEETKTNGTDVGGKCSQEEVSGEPSASVVATIPGPVSDDSKVSSPHGKDVETDKLEKNIDSTGFTHSDVAVGSKGTAVDHGSTPFVETADWGHAKHHDRELKMVQSIEAGQNQLDVHNAEPQEIICSTTGAGSCIQDSSVPENCMDKDFAARVVSSSHTHSVPGEGSDAVLKGNVNASIVATDASVSSISQDDSVEGQWGSISDIPTPKESSDLSLKKGSASVGTHVDNSDVFEAPSFMTLVEPSKGDKRLATSEIQSVQKPGSPSSQPGWFPSLTHVVNESQGRKKNEEIIAKVVNWSPGKPHTPLRSLLVEANAESKNKVLQKMQDHSSLEPREEHASQDKGAFAPVKTDNQEVRKETTATGDVEKEWSSPARLPVLKRERRKVRGWMPFVCCSSIN